MPDPQDRPGESGNKLGFPFLPVPEAVKAAIRDGKLKPLDGIVLGMLLRQRRLKNSCSAHLCTQRRMAAELGKPKQMIYRSFRRLKGEGWIEHFQVECPDPDDPHNSTGYRIRFPWIKRGDSYTIRTTGGFTGEAPPPSPVKPPPTALIRGTRGGLRESDERESNDDDGHDGAPRDRHDRASAPSSSSSSRSPRGREAAGRPVPDPAIDRAELEALASTIAEMFGWTPEDARARIEGELENGHSLAKIRNAAAEMRRTWSKIRNPSWGWMHGTLKKSGPDGPLPPPPPAKAPAAKVEYHTADRGDRKPSPPPPGFTSWVAWLASGTPLPEDGDAPGDGAS